MIKIGLTGGLGCDYSEVLLCLEKLNIPVFDADKCAQILVERNDIKDNLIHIFGRKVQNSDGTINRSELSSMVFASHGSEKLRNLNSLLHKLVRNEFEHWINKTGSPYSSKEIVIEKTSMLFESNAYKNTHYKILIDSPFSKRAENLSKRTGKTMDNILDISRHQWSRTDRAKNSDFIIDSEKNIEEQLNPIFENLKVEIEKEKNTMKPSWGSTFSPSMYTQQIINRYANMDMQAPQVNTYYTIDINRNLNF